MEPFVWRWRSRLSGPVLAGLVGAVWIGKGHLSCQSLMWPASYSWGVDRKDRPI